MAVKRVLELKPIKLLVKQNMHSQPTPMGQKITVIDAGTILYDIEKVIVGDWRLVEHNGSLGWIYSAFLKEL